MSLHTKTASTARDRANMREVDRYGITRCEGQADPAIPMHVVRRDARISFLPYIEDPSNARRIWPEAITTSSCYKIRRSMAEACHVVVRHILDWPGHTKGNVKDWSLLHCRDCIVWRRGAKPAHVRILANTTQYKEWSPAQRSRESNQE